MDHIDTLVKRLRAYSQSLVAYKLDADFADACTEAADKLERMQAKLDEAKSNYEQLREENHSIVKTGEQMYQQAICDIPHNCHTCMHRSDPMCPGNKAKNSFGFQANCASWQWRGLEEA